MISEAILVVDDDASERLQLGKLLRNWGFVTLFAQTGTEALELLQQNEPDLVISDLNLSDLDGVELLGRVKALYPEISYIVLTAHGTINSAVACLKQGANDFLERPLDQAQFKAAIEKALAYRKLSDENRKLKLQLTELYSFQQIVTKSPEMRHALRLAEQVAVSPNTTVALFGESGVGKEVLARAIHFGSSRPENRFVAINCAGIPATLLESELFGHVRGAFTGADRDREGLFGLARDGTVLLDEIGDMPLELQAKVLRVLEERSYLPVGSNRELKADFRIIVATHHDLGGLVRRGKFRTDLYHRITTFPITIPPLRERRDDIPLLVRHFLQHLRNELGKPLPGISRKGMDLLLGHHWPGNIRELKNCLERAAIMVDNELIKPSHLAFLGNLGQETRSPSQTGLTGGGGEPYELHLTLPPHGFSLDAVLDQLLKLTLARCNNNKSLAALLLKADRRIFYRKK